MAMRPCDKVEKQTEDVPAPKALIATEEDARMWKLPVAARPVDRLPPSFVPGQQLEPEI